MSEIYGRYRAALRAGKVYDAIEEARRLPGLLSLIDALELTLRFAECGGNQKIYEEMAARWVARITVERDLPLGQQLEIAKMLAAAGKGEGDPFPSLAPLAV